MVRQRGGEGRGPGGHAETVGVAGVHAAQQGRDQALEHLVAHPAAHQLAHRLVTARPGRTLVGAHGQVLGGPLDPGRRHRAGGGQRVEIGGDAEHQAVGERPKLTEAVEVGLAGGRRDQLVIEPELAAQVDRVGDPGQEGVGGLVDGPPGEGRGADLAAEALAGLEHHHLDVVVGQAGAAHQLVGRAQAGHATTHHGHPHLSLLRHRRRPAVRRRGRRRPWRRPGRPGPP